MYGLTPKPSGSSSSLSSLSESLKSAGVGEGPPQQREGSHHSCSPRLRLKAAVLCCVHHITKTTTTTTKNLSNNSLGFAKTFNILKKHPLQHLLGR